MKTTERIALGLFAAMLCIGLILMGIIQYSRAEDHTALPALTAQILKVGKADSIVIREGESNMVIDAGEEDDGLEIIEHLTLNQIDHIDTLVITHFDKDHVGGADTLIENFQVNRVIVPDYEGAGTDYSDFLSAIETAKKEKNTELIRLTESMEFEIGTASVLIEPPLSYEIPAGATELDNDFSLITTVEHGGNTLLFMGDAEKKLIREWLANGNVTTCDFLKLPHHGVYTTAYADLLEATRPDYAAICTSSKNPAEEKTLQLLKAYQTKVYETKNGDITVTSDGTKLSVQQGKY